MWKVRAPWLLAGLVAGLSGLATSYLVAEAMSLRVSPIPAVGELIIRITPGQAVEAGVQSVGTNDKPLLVLGIWIFLLLAFAAIGLACRRVWWAGTAGFGALGIVGAIAFMTAHNARTTDLAPVVVGFVTWMVAISMLTERIRRVELLGQAEAGEAAVATGRRSFLVVTAAFAVGSAVVGVVGEVAGGGRRRVEQARQLVRLPITQPSVPDDATVDVDGVQPWMTPTDDFYQISTAIISPTIEPKDWSLRIHGMVENEIVLTYDMLRQRQFTEQWVTLNCVSNPVGGDYIGNAWWSGIPLAPLLAEAKPLAGADAVLQTSDDGWTCGTPLEAMTDDRGAMLAVAMNGAPLPIEHGFPVRTIVPGLYGYVSATKWVRDMEVTQFSEIEAYWTKRGWGEKGPVKIASKIEVPGANDSVPAGTVTFAGTAWDQTVGIQGVEISLDGGGWVPATVAGVPNKDTWVQWRASVDGVSAGDHVVRVRAIDGDGNAQTGVVRDVLPDGATGWDEVQFTAT